MRFLQSKVVVGLAGFIFGLGTMFATLRITGRTTGSGHSAPPLKAQDDSSLANAIDDFNSDSFYNSPNDPFAQMRRMQGRLLKQFNQPPMDSGLSGFWNPTLFSSNEVGEIKRREDEKFVYYEIPIKGLKKEKLNVKVSDGQISISGQTETKSDDGSSRAFLTSSFHRSFPVPSDVDANKVQMENTNNQLVIKFPKTA